MVAFEAAAADGTAPSTGRPAPAGPARLAERSWQRRRDERIAAAAQAGWLAALR